jgi:hypothetical protein
MNRNQFHDFTEKIIEIIKVDFASNKLILLLNSHTKLNNNKLGLLIFIGK